MYKKAELNLITFAVEDVIVTSGANNGGNINGSVSHDGDPIVIPPGNEDAPEPE